MTTVYVVCDASGEYLAPNGGRTPASNEASECDTYEEALAACARATDRVFSREYLATSWPRSWIAWSAR